MAWITVLRIRIGQVGARFCFIVHIFRFACLPAVLILAAIFLLVLVQPQLAACGLVQGDFLGIIRDGAFVFQHFPFGSTAQAGGNLHIQRVGNGGAQLGQVRQPVADAADMGDQDAIDEMYGEFGEGEW